MPVRKPNGRVQVFDFGLIWIARVSLLLIIAALLSATMTEVWWDVKSTMEAHLDKVGHFVFMFVVTLIALFALPNVNTLWVLLGSLFLAAAIELAQLFNSRSADMTDFVAGAIGTFFVWAACFCTSFRNQAKWKS